MANVFVVFVNEPPLLGTWDQSASLQSHQFDPVPGVHTKSVVSSRLRLGLIPRSESETETYTHYIAHSLGLLPFRGHGKVELFCRRLKLSRASQ